MCEGRVIALATSLFSPHFAHCRPSPQGGSHLNHGPNEGHVGEPSQGQDEHVTTIGRSVIGGDTGHRSVDGQLSA